MTTSVRPAVVLEGTEGLKFCSLHNTKVLRNREVMIDILKGTFVLVLDGNNQPGINF